MRAARNQKALFNNTPYSFFELCLQEALAKMSAEGSFPGLVETSPGVRSCMIEYDIGAISPGRLLQV
jgi:hypothetical protein